jgi:hypothetical protein
LCLLLSIANDTEMHLLHIAGRYLL